MSHLIRNSKLFRKLTIIVLTATLTAQSFAGGIVPETTPPVTSHAITAPSEPGRALSTREVYLKTLKAVTLITNEANNSIGTGWIVDVERRLIVTNEHVISKASEVLLNFPVHKNGQLQTDFSSLKEVTPIRGVVIDSIEYADLAVVQADSLPSDVHALSIATSSANPGERVHAVGGIPRGSQGLWKYSTGFVSLVSKAQGPTGTPIRVMQSNIDINFGNSGGPIVNDHGLVVGVVQSINTQARDVSYNVDVTELQTYLNTLLPLIDNNSATALLELGKRNRNENRPTTALTYLSRALQADPNLIEAQIERGWAFLNMGDRVTAINDFTSAIAKSPNSASAYRGRGKVYYAMQEYTKAASDYSMAIANDPTNASLYHDRALAQEMNKDYTLALGDYGQAIRLDGDNAVFIANRGDLYAKMKDHRNAVRDLDRALTISPNFAFANNRMGVSLHALKEYKLARPYLLKACDLNPNVVKYIKDFGETLQSLGEHEFATKVWSKAIEKDSKNAYNYFSRAWSLYKLNNHRVALKDLNTAIQLNSKDASYFALRSKVNEALGNSQAAQEDIARASQLDPQRYASNNSNRNNNSSRNTRQDTSRRNASNPLEGRWYVKTTVDGRQIEMTQVFYGNGNYECLLIVVENGETKRTEESGKYRLAGNKIEFNTNLGEYSMDCKMENGMFWLLFENWNNWIGSVRR